MELTGLKRIRNKSLPKFVGGGEIVGYDSITDLIGANSPYIGNIQKQSIQNTNTDIKKQQWLQNPVMNQTTNPFTGVNYGNKKENIPQKNTLNIEQQLPEMLSFATTAINNASPGFDHNDLIAATGNSYGSVRGVKYARRTGIESAIDDAESQLQSRQLSNIVSLIGQGANIGSNLMGSGSAANFKFKNGKLPGFSFGGALIGGGAGLIAGALTSAISASKADSEERMMRDFLNREDIFNRNGALSTVMQQDDLLARGNQEQYKIRYKNGKCPKYSNGAEVHTSHGVANTDNIPQNSWVDGEEKIFGADGSVHQIPPSPSGKTDTFRANVKDGDLILPKEYADLANTREQAEYVMNYIVAPEMRAKGVPGYSKGKLPGYKFGSQNTLMTSLGVLGGATQMLSALNSSVKRPNTFVKNPYGQRAANILAGMRISDYPILPELYNQYAKTMYGISNSGGLSGGQKTLARLSALNNLQNNYAKLQQSNQMQNNQYKTTYADYISKLGAQEASDRMNAMRHDLDYYSKAHAAKQNGIQVGYANIMNALGQGYKNYIKEKQFEDTISLYQSDQKLKQDEIQMLKNSMNSYAPYMTQDQWKRIGELNKWR